jgi:anti-sigma factor RsiW
VKQQPYITCRELIDFIADYLDDTLPPASRHEFERHLSVCPSCVAYLQGYKEAIRLGRAALMKSDEPADVPESLVLAIRAARAKG